jgi:hypothetical protein
MRQARLALGHPGLVDPIAITDEQPSQFSMRAAKTVVVAGGKWTMWQGKNDQRGKQLETASLSS